MKSNKQKRLELQVERQIRRAKEAKEAAQKASELAQREYDRLEAEGILVDASKLTPDGSYDVPVFVSRGYYEDVPFTCCECGKEEVWTATQQKWWYEIAKGKVWTTARRCRPCRQCEGRRRSESRRVHQQGIARKSQEKSTRPSLGQSPIDPG